MQRLNAQERVHVGQEVQRVAREVGKPVIFDRVDAGGVVAGRGGAVERHAQARQVQRVGDRLARRGLETVEARQQTAVGRAGVTDQQEVHVGLGDAGVFQLLHDVAGDRRALRIAEHRRGVAVGDVRPDCVVQDRIALAHRGGARRETVGAGRVVQRQGFHPGQGVQALGGEQAVAESRQGVSRGGRGSLVEVDVLAVGREKIVLCGGRHVLGTRDGSAAAADDQADVLAVGVRRGGVQQGRQAHHTGTGGGDHPQTHETKRAS